MRLVKDEFYSMMQQDWLENTDFTTGKSLDAEVSKTGAKD